jgi:low affinity Fe/Cu permease
MAAMDRWNRFAHAITHFAGTKRFFAVVVVLLAVWAVDGLVAGSSRPWELCVTCGVPILTLLMVIVLQHAQNRDSKAIQLKLNELLLALDQPDSELIRAGHLGDEELNELGERYERKA